MRWIIPSFVGFISFTLPVLALAQGIADPVVGPSLGGQPLHVFVDLLASLIALSLMLKMGTGKLKYPIFVFVIGYLTSALVRILGGYSYAWLVPLIKSFTDFIGLIWLFSLLGGFVLFRRKG
ncbi:MAG: hypothetical protein HY459_04680 [Parcubacteria group bacterium]|nr:hypothetical protein [Parcubacteria group bacterium]